MTDIPLTEQVARALLPDDQHDDYTDQDWPSNVSKAKEVIGLVVEALAQKAESLENHYYQQRSHGMQDNFAITAKWLREQKKAIDN